MTGRNRTFLLLALALAAALAALAPLASRQPDGLERVVADHARPAGETPAAPAPMSDYSIPGLANRPLSTVLAGLAGVAAVFLASLALARLLRRRHKPAVGDRPGETSSSC